MDLPGPGVHRAPATGVTGLRYPGAWSHFLKVALQNGQNLKFWPKTVYRADVFLVSHKVGEKMESKVQKARSLSKNLFALSKSRT